MYDPNQHFVDLQKKSKFGDSNSWLLDDDHNNNISSSTTNNNNNSSPKLRQTHSNSASAANIDPLLLNDFVEMVPLIESLMHQKANSSFTRRGSMVYTKTPSRESLFKKMTDPKGRNATQSIPTKKKREYGDKDQGKYGGGNNQDSDNYSIFSSRSLASDKDMEELVMLREQVEDLQRKLAEKDELLKSAEMSKNQMNAVHGKLDELKHLAAEKDSLIKSTQLQLSDAKIKLADKQAALEKIQWEAMTSNTKVEKLQEELDSIQGDISSVMLLFEGLTNNDSTKNADDYDVEPHFLDYLPDVDDMDDMDMQEMEEARQAYIAAVAAAKEKQDEESIAAAASARLNLQYFVLRSNNRNGSKDFSNGRVSPTSYRANVDKV